MAETKPRVVIVGGGFGGISAAKALANAPVEVTLIDRTNHHLFQPLLYQVAMAGLSPAEVAYPIRSILREQQNTTVLLSTVTAIHPDRKVIATSDGDIPYDYLILATGACTNFRGKEAWTQNAIGLKNLDDALEIRRRVLVAFEAAERETDPAKQKALLNFVIIGGGPTGVEIAGALAELARFVLAQDFRRVKPDSAKIILLHGGNRILQAYPEDLSAKAHEYLERLGAQVRLKAYVGDITEHGVKVGEELIPSSTVIWCAGVSATPLTKTVGAKMDSGGRILVEPDLSVPGRPEVFVVGDACTFVHQDGNPLPGLAPVANQQGKAAADNVIATLNGQPRKKFHYKHKGTLATIGRSSAVAEFGKIKLTGFIAWLAWLFIHVFFLIGFRNKVVVMFEWLWNYITYQRGARLITGGRMDAGAPDVQPEGIAEVQ